MRKFDFHKTYCNVDLEKIFQKRSKVDTIGTCTIPQEFLEGLMKIQGLNISKFFNLWRAMT